MGYIIGLQRPVSHVMSLVTSVTATSVEETENPLVTLDSGPLETVMESSFSFRFSQVPVFPSLQRFLGFVQVLPTSSKSR